jgi:thioesterase domain-containing protein
MLFQAPTVAELLGTLAPPGRAAGMLPIRTVGTRPPLFCLPPASGLSLCYTGLRSHLPADQPIYGLQGGSGASIEQVAAGYLTQLREIQPVGPYHLLGWSFGGHVAHSMAALLRQAGEQVRLLAVLDAYPHDPRLSDPGLREYTVAADLLSRHTWPHYDGDLLFFTATEGRAGTWPTALDWRPYIGGGIESQDIPCGHFAMTEPDKLAVIGSVLAQRLPGGTHHAH